MDLNTVAGNRKVQFAVACVALALLLIFMRDFNPATIDTNFGIEFIGGVRIPISLEKPVDSATMGSMVDTLKLRVNKYGLSQAVVRPLGDSEIIVEIPRADPSVISSVEKILREQGRFQAIIDGREALSGSDIMTNAVGGSGAERIEVAGNDQARWELDFAATREGGEKFAKVANGKANYPVYMFLDRPSNAALIVSRSEFNATGLSYDKAVSDALRLTGDDITLVYAENFDNASFAALNKTVVVIGKTTFRTFAGVSAGLAALGFSEPKPGIETQSKTILVREDADISPAFYQTGFETAISSWKAIGLLSGPTLSPGLANGYVSQFYSISGGATGATLAEQKARAASDIKELKSVISGGRLPVSTIIGSAYTVEASLGSQFLSYSFYGTILAIFAVSIVIVIKYRMPKLIVPIVLVNSAEILILFAVTGTFGTVDLSTMAGIITLIGTGVNDQIVITDEMLRRREHGEAQRSDEREAKEKLGRAFEIIFTVAGVSVVSMLPLLLSGIVEMMGFALASILGVLIGVGITRPAYGAVMELMFGKHRAEEHAQPAQA